MLEGLVVRAGILGVRQIVEELVVLARRERRVQREVTLRDGERLGHLFFRDVHPLGDLLHGGLAAQLLEQRGRTLADAVQRPGAVQGHAHDAALLGERLEDGLTDPPDRVGDELDALGFVELVGRADQAEVALVDEIGETDTLVLVFLGDRDDEAQVAADQLVQGRLATTLDLLGEVDLVFAGDEGILADLAQVLVERALIERRLLDRT